MEAERIPSTSNQDVSCKTMNPTVQNDSLELCRVYIRWKHPERSKCKQGSRTLDIDGSQAQSRVGQVDRSHMEGKRLDPLDLV